MKKLALLIVFVSALAAAQNPPVLYGIPANSGAQPNWSGSAVYPPTQYGTLADPTIGKTNRITDPEFGTPIWKVANMFEPAFNEAIDEKDRYVASQLMTAGSLANGPNWYGTNGLRILNMTTGAMACDIEIVGRQANLWGRTSTILTNSGNAWAQNDTYWLILRTTGEVVRVNIPVCEAATIANPSFQLTSTTQTSPQGNVSDVWDTLYPTTSRLDTNGNPVGETGTVTCATGVCTWQNGVKFASSWVGQTMMIGGVTHTISAYTSATQISITPTDTYSSATDFQIAWDTIGSCRGTTDMSPDGNHICIDNETGGNAYDPRLYTIVGKTIGPPLTPDPANVNSYYRSAWFAPTYNTSFVVPFSATGATQLDLYDGTTGNKTRTITTTWGHATTSVLNGVGYAITDQSTNMPANCAAPAYVMYNIENPANPTCLVENLAGEPYLNGTPGDTGKGYIIASIIDMPYSYFPFTTASGLASVTGNNWWVTDALTAGNCATGGGTNWAYCHRDPLISTQWNNQTTASYPLESNWQTSWADFFYGSWKKNYFNNEIVMVPLDGTAPRHMVHHRSQTMEPYDMYQAVGKRGTANCVSGVCTVATGDNFVTDGSWSSRSLYLPVSGIGKTISTVNSATQLTLTDATYNATGVEWIFTSSVPYWSAVHPRTSWSGKYTAFASTWGQHNTINMYVAQLYPDNASVTVTPFTATIPVSGSIQFNASPSGATWSVSVGCTGSVGSTSGVFIATSTAESCGIVATEGSVTGTATVTTIVPAITPATTSMTVGAIQQFSANFPGTWAATGGTITSAGLYTAPQTNGTYTITFTATNGGATTTATVTVTGQVTLIPLSISPTSWTQQTTISTPITKIFTASNIGTGAVTPTVTLTGASAFTISANTCTGAVSGGGNCTVTIQFLSATVGTFAGNLNISDTAGGNQNLPLSVSIPSGTTVIISPKTAAIPNGGHQQFSASTSNGSSVTWSTTCVTGTVTTGFFTDSAAEVCTVTATATDGSGANDIASVTVVNFAVSPVAVTIQSGAQQQFTANFAATFSVTSGSCTTTSSGFLTAGPIGSCVLTAAATNGGATATATISVVAAPPTGQGGSQKGGNGKWKVFH